MGKSYYKEGQVIYYRVGQSLLQNALREKCPNTELFLVRIPENTDQK